MEDNVEFFDRLKVLLERWSDRRAFDPLARVLPAYVAFNGLTDGWADILDALKAVRAFDSNALIEPESATLNDLIRAAEKVVFR